MMTENTTNKLLQKLARNFGTNNIALIVSIVVLMLVMTLNYEYFLTWPNMKVVAMGFVLEAVVAIGMTLVIISGGIDLSVGSVLAFTAIVTAYGLKSGMPAPVAIIISLFGAGLIGFLNARMAKWFRVHPFIATLATMLMIRGVNLVVTDGATISGLGREFCFIGQAEMLGIPFPIVIFAVIAIAVGCCLKKHRFFRQVYFVGDNAQAARMSGINVDRFLAFTYIASAVLAGVAGVIAAAQYGSASNTFGQGVELRVITAVVIGGASLRGGVGTVFGTFLGVLFLAIVNNAFVMTEISSYWQEIVNGGMLLIAVLLGQSLNKRGRERIADK